MIHRPRRLVPAALAVAATALVTACASPPTRFFTLDPIAPAQPVAATGMGAALKVLAVNIPPVLDRQDLVQEIGPGEIKLHDFEQWSAPLGQTARQVLIQDLAARLPAGEVLGPDAPTGAHVATLSVDVVAFSAGPAGATMQASWTATLPPAAGATGATAVIRGPLQQLQGPAETADGAGTAHAFSALLAQMSDQIAATLPARMQDAIAREAEREAAAQVQTTRTRTTATQRNIGQPS